MRLTGNAGRAGIQIEEPFHILPILAYSAGVASNTREQVAQRRGVASSCMFMKT